jgi:excisionase family DNA binding protein
MHAKQYLREQQVANITGLSLSTLRNDRCHARRLPYIKVGKAVRYEYSDVINFMEARKIQCAGAEH